MALLLENSSSYNYEDSMNNIPLSLDSHKSVPAPFLTKTYHLVDDSFTDHIVSWGDDHSTFIVWRPPEFARDILPNYFKHNNFSSFVRQLNTYGFRKIVPDRWEFANEFFKKGEKHLLCEINRRKTSQSQGSINHHHNHNPYLTDQLGFGQQNQFPYPGWSTLSPPISDENININLNTTSLSPWGCNNDFAHPHLSTPSPVIAGRAVALSEDNERLRRSNTMIMSELEHMRKLYNDIIYFVQNNVKPVAPSNVYHRSLPLVLTSMNENQDMHCRRRVGHFDDMSNNTSQSSVTVVEEVDNDEDGENRKLRLFGVPLRTWSSSGKKRLHSELGLNLMPPSPC